MIHRSFGISALALALALALPAALAPRPAAADAVGFASSLHVEGARLTVEDMVELPSGAIAVGNVVRDGEATAAWMARLRADGTVVWTRLFDERLGQVAIQLGLPRVERFAVRDAVQHTDGTVWFVGEAWTGAPDTHRFGFLLGVQPDGRMTEYNIRGHTVDGRIDDGLNGIASGPDGLVAVGGSNSAGRPTSWLVVLVPGEGIVIDSPFADGIAGHLNAAALGPDGRLMVVLVEEATGETRADRFITLPANAGRPFSWRDGVPIDATVPADAPAMVFTALDDGSVVLFYRGEAAAGASPTQVGWLDPQGSISGNLSFSDDRGWTEILDAVPDGGSALAVGTSHTTGQPPGLWVGAIRFRPTVEVPGHLVMDWREAPTSAAIVGGLDRGALLAIGVSNGSVATLALPDPRTDLYDSAISASRLIALGAVAEVEGLCHPAICAWDLRLPQVADGLGSGENPFDRSLREQRAEVAGIDFGEDGTLLAAGTSGGLGSGGRAVHWVRRFAADGAEVWSTRIAGEDGQRPDVQEVVALPGGAVLAVGRMDRSNVVDGRIHRVRTGHAWLLDGEGSVQQVVEVDGVPASGGLCGDEGLVAATRLGELAVVAGTPDESPPEDSGLTYGQGVVAAIDAGGEVVWRTHLPGDDSYGDTILLSDVAALPDGGLAVTGSARGSAGCLGHAAGYLALLDGTGALAWQSPRDLFAGADVTAVTAGDDGTVYVAGAGGLCGDQGFPRIAWVAALAEDRSIAATHCLDRDGRPQIEALAFVDGHLVVAGERRAGDAEGLGGDAIGWLAVIDPAGGEVLAEQTVGIGLEEETLADLALGPDGQVWVAGEISSFRGTEGWIARLADGFR
ncbi:MAG: hypothetical protein H6843_17230 [Rhodospirillaceae bacterium]|nr:hypothetical protein [Rhodospirillaceae bacterium]